jgi:hypothetical protein
MSVTVLIYPGRPMNLILFAPLRLGLVWRARGDVLSDMAQGERGSYSRDTGAGIRVPALGDHPLRVGEVLHSRCRSGAISGFAPRSLKIVS